MSTLTDYSTYELLPSQKEYPSQLHGCYKVLPKLYCVSTNGLLDASVFQNCLAFVGSRKPSVYGRRLVSSLIASLHGTGLTIVSGFMHGIDLLAHEEAIKQGLRTVAVLPCGIDYRFDAVREKVLEQIISSGGCVVSEFSGWENSQKWMFVKRNKLVAALSLGVVVVEATSGSGSLITANYARKLSRNVMACPGSVFSVLSNGTNQLLKDGAVVVTEATDILKTLKNPLADSYCQLPEKQVSCHGLSLLNIEKLGLTPLQKEIVTVLNSFPLDLDSLFQEFPKENFNTMNTNVTQLLLSDVIREEEGTFYVC